MRARHKNPDGSLGGWVESTAHVGPTATVGRNAWVSGNAWVTGNAVVSGNAYVTGNAQVAGNAQVTGNAVVSGNAYVTGNAHVAGDAHVTDDAYVSDRVLRGSDREASDVASPGPSPDSGSALVHDRIYCKPAGHSCTRDSDESARREPMVKQRCGH